MQYHLTRVSKRIRHRAAWKAGPIRGAQLRHPLKPIKHHHHMDRCPCGVPMRPCPSQTPSPYGSDHHSYANYTIALILSPTVTLLTPLLLPYSYATYVISPPLYLQLRHLCHFFLFLSTVTPLVLCHPSLSHVGASMRSYSIYKRNIVPCFFYVYILTH